MVRRLSGFIAVLIFGLVLSPTVSAFAAGAAYSISPAQGPAGTVITVHGTGCPANSGGGFALIINPHGHFSGQPQTPIRADETGTFTASLKVPTDLTVGQYDTGVFCGSTGDSGWPNDRLAPGHVFSVTEPILTYMFSPTSGPVGTVIHFSGKGCPPNPSPPSPGTDLTFLVTNGLARAQGYKSNPDGSFSGDYTVLPTSAAAKPFDPTWPTDVFCTTTQQLFSAGTFTITPPGRNLQLVLNLKQQLSPMLAGNELNASQLAIVDTALRTATIQAIEADRRLSQP